MRKLFNFKLCALAVAFAVSSASLGQALPFDSLKGSGPALVQIKATCESKNRCVERSGRPAAKQPDEVGIKRESIFVESARTGNPQAGQYGHYGFYGQNGSFGPDGFSPQLGTGGYDRTSILRMGNY